MGWIAKWMDKILGGIPDAHIDCFLFASLAWFIFLQSYLGGDEAAKYINPLTKFWLCCVVGSGATIAGAVKMFRSTSYAKLQEKRAPAEDAIQETEFFRKASVASSEAKIAELKAAAEVEVAKAELTDTKDKT